MVWATGSFTSIGSPWLVGQNSTSARTGFRAGRFAATAGRWNDRPAAVLGEQLQPCIRSSTRMRPCRHSARVPSEHGAVRGPRMMRSAWLQLAINSSLSSASALPASLSRGGNHRSAYRSGKTSRRYAIVPWWKKPRQSSSSMLLREFGWKARTTRCPARHRDQTDSQRRPLSIHQRVVRAYPMFVSARLAYARTVSVNTLSSFDLSLFRLAWVCLSRA